MNYITAQIIKSVKSAKGFTLIELLVTITILAILAVIGAAVYNNVSASARDAKRAADVEAIANAIENTYNSANTNPYDAAPTSFAGGEWPVEPIGTRQYCYWGSTTPQGQAPNPGSFTGSNCTGTSVFGITGTTITASLNPTAAVVWKVCAMPESGAVICRSNQR